MGCSLCGTVPEEEGEHGGRYLVSTSVVWQHQVCICTQQKHVYARAHTQTHTHTHCAKHGQTVRYNRFSSFLAASLPTYELHSRYGIVDESKGEHHGVFYAHVPNEKIFGVRIEEKILNHHLWGHRSGGEVLVLVRECDDRDGERHSEAHDDGGENMDEGEPGRWTMEFSVVKVSVLSVKLVVSQCIFRHHTAVG